jgi:hypothetical protein
VSKKGSESLVFSFGAEGEPICAFFVLNFVFRLFEFVSDFELRISDLPHRSVSASLRIRPTKLTLWTKAKVCDKACFESRICKKPNSNPYFLIPCFPDILLPDTLIS